jgi:hypothetical protein
MIDACRTYCGRTADGARSVRLRAGCRRRWRSQTPNLPVTSALPLQWWVHQDLGAARAEVAVAVNGAVHFDGRTSGEHAHGDCTAGRFDSGETCTAALKLA